MVLRDPPTLHLLAAEVVAQLHACVATYTLPAANEALHFVLQLMYLAVQSKAMLREVGESSCHGGSQCVGGIGEQGARVEQASLVGALWRSGRFRRRRLTHSAV